MGVIKRTVTRCDACPFVYSPPNDAMTCEHPHILKIRVPWGERILKRRSEPPNWCPLKEHPILYVR